MQTASVVGPTEKRWGQTFTHEHLFVVIELVYTPDVSEVGHQIFESLTRAYDDLQPHLLSQLEQLVKNVKLPPDSTIVVALIDNDKLHVTGLGTGTAYVYRDSAWAPIFFNNQSISGPLLPGDRIFLCTPALIQAISEEDLAILAQPEELGDIEEDVATSLRTSLYADGAACLIVQYDTTQPIEKEELIEAPYKEEEIFSPRDEKERISTISPKQKITAAVGMGLATILIISLIFGSKERARIEREQQLAQVLGAVTSNLDEGAALVDVNPSEARGKLLPVREQLTNALNSFPENSKEYQQVAELVNKTSELLQQSEKKYEITDPELFMDITWIKENAKGYRMHRFEDTLAILDRDNGALYSTSLTKKNNTIKASDDMFKDARDISYNSGKIYALIYSDGAKLVDEEKQTVVDSFEDGDPIALEAFNDNLYNLDTKKGVLKLPKTDSGFGSPRPWFEGDVSLDLADAKDIAIDGSIWVLTNDNILKFTQGFPDSYSLTDEVLQTARALYTDSESAFLYILEENRIVVFDKKGMYQEQYVWSGLSNATDIIVLEDKQILILSGNSIYQITRKV